LADDSYFVFAAQTNAVTGRTRPFLSGSAILTAGKSDILTKQNFPKIVCFLANRNVKTKFYLIFPLFAEKRL
jgi:hypothetical protein